MKIGITTKAFCAVLLVALAVLLAMGVAGRWSFSRGFIGYLDELAQARLEEVAYAPGDTTILSFTYSAPNKGGPQYYTVLVPIPRGEEGQAKAILAFFQQPGQLRPRKGKRG